MGNGLGLRVQLYVCHSLNAPHVLVIGVPSIRHPCAPAAESAKAGQAATVGTATIDVGVHDPGEVELGPIARFGTIAETGHDDLDETPHERCAYRHNFSPGWQATHSTAPILL